MVQALGVVFFLAVLAIVIQRCIHTGIHLYMCLDSRGSSTWCSFLSCSPCNGLTLTPQGIWTGQTRNLICTVATKACQLDKCWHKSCQKANMSTWQKGHHSMWTAWKHMPQGIWFGCNMPLYAQLDLQCWKGMSAWQKAHIPPGRAVIMKKPGNSNQPEWSIYHCFEKEQSLLHIV